MKKFKKIILTVFTVAFIAALGGCGKQDATDTSKIPTETNGNESNTNETGKTDSVLRRNMRTNITLELPL
ncbi:MAG: hypothetical protein ACFWTJ_12245 [Lachnoclostridium sp.]|jgi:uncharacterized lipoprotein YehR (DUF1307 family)